MTIAWMMALVSTVGCEFGAIVSRAYVWWLDPEAVGIGLFSGVMWFASLVTSAISLLLLAVVLRTNQVRPPTTVLATAVTIAALPWFPALLLALQRLA